MLGAEQRLVPIAVTSRSPRVGSTHPRDCPRGQRGCPASLDIPLGWCWDSGKTPATACRLAWGSLVASAWPGGVGLRGGVEVCVYVLVFSSRSRPRATEQALCLPARLPVTAPSISQPPCTACSHFGRSCLGILMWLINAPRCNLRAGHTPSPVLPFGGINKQNQPGTLTNGTSPHPKVSWGMGPR